MANLEYGLQQWQEIAELQNELIRRHSEVPKDSPLWKKKLHRLNNEDWIEILQVIARLVETAPDLFLDYQIKAFERGAEIIKKHGKGNDRVLDTKLFKRDCWRMTMCLREVWNRCRDDGFRAQ